MVVSAKVPGCKFIIDRRIKDTERNKECLETDAGKSINAILQGRLRLEQLEHYNTRDAARKKFMRAKAEKNRVSAVKAATKKRLFLWKKDKKRAGRGDDEVWEHLHAP